MPLTAVIAELYGSAFTAGLHAAVLAAGVISLLAAGLALLQIRPGHPSAAAGPGMGKGADR